MAQESLELKTCKKNLHQYPVHLKKCPECYKIWRQNNSERLKKLQKNWRLNNPDKIKEMNKRYRENPVRKETRLNQSREWKKKNPDRNKEKSREWRIKNAVKCKKTLQKWRKENAEHVRKVYQNWSKRNVEHVRKKAAINSAKRRNIHLKATPPWADLEKIKAIYSECYRLTSETGIKHHVDHIFPLRSIYMCGLNVENNLQILTAEENISKGNREWPGQLECQRT